jgi:hypothetical protein
VNWSAIAASTPAHAAPWIALVAADLLVVPSLAWRPPPRSP